MEPNPGWKIEATCRSLVRGTRDWNPFAVWQRSSRLCAVGLVTLGGGILISDRSSEPPMLQRALFADAVLLGMFSSGAASQDAPISLTGVIDFHPHAGPNSRPRELNDLEAARWSAQRGRGLRLTAGRDRDIWPCEECLGYNDPETACKMEISGAARVSTSQTSMTTGPSFSNSRGSLDAAPRNSGWQKALQLLVEQEPELTTGRGIASWTRVKIV